MSETERENESCILQTHQITLILKTKQVICYDIHFRVRIRSLRTNPYNMEVSLSLDLF